MAYRYQPYARRDTASLELWSGAKSVTHNLKTTANADRYFFTNRSLGAFDGVGGVAEIGLDPAAMAVHMCNQMQVNIAARLSKNAQKFDRDMQLTLQSSTPPGNGGWLTNLAAGSFLETEALGSTTLGVCHLTGLNAVMLRGSYVA